MLSLLANTDNHSSDVIKKCHGLLFMLRRDNPLDILTILKLFPDNAMQALQSDYIGFRDES